MKTGSGKPEAKLSPQDPLVPAHEPNGDPRRTSFFSSLAYVFGFFFALALLAWVGACLLRRL